MERRTAMVILALGLPGLALSARPVDEATTTVTLIVSGMT